METTDLSVDALRVLIKQLIKEELNSQSNITSINSMANDVTIVTGLWDLGRGEIPEFTRPYNDYLNKFAELLKTPNNMVIYVSKKDEEFIWKHRSKNNTVVNILESEHFEKWFDLYDKVQEIRTNETWRTQANWLTNSPQATLKYYNPVVMSKMFLLNDSTIHNHFNSEYFFWIDAGITNTVHQGYFNHDMVLNNLPTYADFVDKFIFLSYPYEGNTEIHGFPRPEMAEQCNTDYVKYVCRGGFFGGNKENISTINSLYYAILKFTLNEGLMGTEESIFTILAHKYPDLISRFELSDDGMVWPFFEMLKDVESYIESIPRELTHKIAKNNLYVLTFNSPKQFKSICESINKADPNFLEKSRNILINNSTDESTFEEYDKLCEEYGFEEIHRENLGVCGGRQFAAEHFAETDADFYMFFEDDMHINNEEDIGTYCRNGFRRHIPNLYNTVVKIMVEEKFDFIKFSFSEFYGDNSAQWSWYNVPQDIRTEMWPEYDKLPEHGLDPNVPKTKFDTIKIMDNIPYITGEIYYSNWPQIVSREGNQKMFLDTKWDHPFEQTWMSHIFQLTKKGEITPAVLLASPVTHERFEFYDGELRKES